MISRLELRLTGDNARLGELYASDLARLIDGVERAIIRAAAQLVGRTPGTAGRPPKAAVQAARLRLTDIREGSLVLELASPDAPSPTASVQDALDLEDSDLGESAMSAIIDVLSGPVTEFAEPAVALNQLAEDLDIGQRYEALVLSYLGDVPREAVLDRTTRERLSAAAEQRTRHDDEGTLVGILYEADFEKCSARLRTPIGSAVTVYFSDNHAQAIKDALRESSQLQGRITYNAATSAIVSVDLTEIALTEQLVMPSIDDFWTARPLEELAEAQGAGVVESIESLRDDTISDEEADAFMAALKL